VSATSGRLILIVGPSGAGKDTLINAARARFRGDTRFIFPRRIVSRPGSAHEDNAYLDADTLAWLALEEAFALSWQAHGLSYAIPRSIETTLAGGAAVICNVSRAVVDAARARYPTSVIQIEASPEALAARLAGRGRASDGDLGKRLDRAAAIDCAPDVVFRNEGVLDETAAAFCLVLESLGPASPAPAHPVIAGSRKPIAG